MRRLFSLLRSIFSLSAVLSAAVAPTNDDINIQVKEMTAVPRGWTRKARAAADLPIRLRIALVQPDFAGLEDALYQISDPDHIRYGDHLSRHQVEEYITPSAASLTMVDDWLASFGVNISNAVRSSAKDWVSVIIPVRLVEQMLSTEYYSWEHTSATTLVRATSYSLPTYLHDHIELIQPTTIFALSHNLPSIIDRTGRDIVAPPPPALPSCNGPLITLSCIMQLYDAAWYKPRATRKNGIGITGFLEQNANRRDLAAFYRDQLPAAVNSTFKTVLVNGGKNNQSISAAGEEANLDTQFGFGVAYPTPGTFWSTGGHPPFSPDTHTPVDTNEPYLDVGEHWFNLHSNDVHLQWLEHVLGSDHIPPTISTSYADDEQTVPFTYASRVCKKFAELGCRGSTLVFASGDFGVGDGVSDPNSQTCWTNNGKPKTRHAPLNCSFFLCLNTPRFMPAFPASCPFVTSVGGTTDIPEVAASFSGGGFSDYFTRPRYQDEAVKGYLKQLPERTYEGLFNRAGRGIPDVSAQSRKFRIYFQDEPISIGGTSAATPVFAGLVALLNDARLAAGQPSLGFLNPLLYKHRGHGFTDVTSGNNPGCGTAGFNATAGWDPVTGLGTPQFRELLGLFVS
ncbi:Peptidase S53 domain-containing protein [Mycena indigotica]|uniref:tripeptidyl-peptidase II n=1 Tax=Mycena indigotica TaxID=2126181 RepID=A0A8H6W204_9AGAR|nr:Peptidase S53 domain-containing protein [Mycena indigotica]KAF7302072.1 Peptidase S53 domain-containing protein [Mycena indigotica]